MRSPKTLPYKLAKTFFLQMPFASGNCIYHARLAATSGTGMRPRCPTSSTCVKTPALGPVLDYGKVPPDLKAGDQGFSKRQRKEQASRSWDFLPNEARSCWNWFFEFN